MKLPLAILLGITGFTFAGTSAPSAPIDEIPVSDSGDSSGLGWFVGGSAGYFFDTYEEEYYTAHFGLKLPSSGGWTTSIYLEGLYSKPEESYFIPDFGNLEGSLKIVPVTVNVAFEKEIAGGLTAFIGGGVGAAFVDLELSLAGESESADDTVLAAQLFGGLGYNVTDNFQAYGAARWLYLDDAELFPLEDDFGAEIGLRLKF